MKIKVKYIAKSLMSIIVILSIVSCGPKPGGPGGMPGGPPPPPAVDIVQLEELMVTDTDDYIGKVYARDTVDIVARVRGYLKAHNFKEGTIVQKGSLLFQIEPDEYKAEVEQAKADIENIKATLVKDEKNLDRVEELVKQDYISHSSHDQALASRDQTMADLKAKEAKLKKAQLNLSYTKIYAPITGKISDLRVTEGNFVGQDLTPLATIVKLNPIYVTYNIPADDFTNLRMRLSKEGKSISNYEVKLVLSDGTPYPYKGIQDFFDNKIDETTGTIKLRATFPNPEGILLPGQLCNVIVYSGQPVLRQTLLQSAVMEDTAGKYVYILDESNTVHRQGIEVGKQIGKNWVVNKGLNKDHRIISTGLQKIRHGMKVQTTSDKQDKAEDKGKH